MARCRGKNWDEVAIGALRALASDRDVDLRFSAEMELARRGHVRDVPAKPAVQPRLLWRVQSVDHRKNGTVVAGRGSKLVLSIHSRMMPSSKLASKETPGLIAEWPLPSAATLGSSVRLKGIEQQVRRRLPWTSRKCVAAASGRIVLRMDNTEEDAFNAASKIISKALDGIEALPIIPREAEDILAMSARERHKWLDDGRLKSAGTRTVKLRGRAKAVTFHVFDPRHIEDVLDEDLPSIWREDDARTAAENRRRAAGKAALMRAAKNRGEVSGASNETSDVTRTPLEGWDAFEADGLLR